MQAYTEVELNKSSAMTCHNHDTGNPTWFSSIDFKVLPLKKPGGAAQVILTEQKHFYMVPRVTCREV